MALDSNVTEDNIRAISSEADSYIMSDFDAIKCIFYVSISFKLNPHDIQFENFILSGFLTYCDSIYMQINIFFSEVNRRTENKYFNYLEPVLKAAFLGGLS